MPAQVAAHPLRHPPADALTTVGLRPYTYSASPDAARPTGLHRESVVPTARGRLPALLGAVRYRGDAPSDAARRFGGPPPSTEMCHVAQGGPGFTIMRSTSQAASEAAAHDADAAQPSSVSVSQVHVYIVNDVRVAIDSLARCIGHACNTRPSKG